MNFLTLLRLRFLSWELPLPRQHLYVVVTLTILTLFSIVLLPAPKIDNQRILTSELVIGADGLKDNDGLEEVIPDHELFDPSKDDQDGSLIPGDVASSWVEHRVRSGETLAPILAAQGLPDTILYKLVDVDKDKRLAKLAVGQQIEFNIDQEGILQQLRLRVSPKETLLFTRLDNSYQVSSELRSSTWQNRVLAGSIEGGFYQSATKAGVSANQIKKIAGLLQSRLNLSNDLKKGDQFHVLVKQEMIEGEKIGSAAVHGIEFKLAGGKYYSAWLAEDGNYYNEKGEALQSEFRRYPTYSRYRVSSTFNPARRHPVTGRVRAHEGVDFSMPKGTPILSTGDGTVVKVSYHGYAGKYVVIKHSGSLTTRYMHLSRALVKPGQKIKAGDKIALSGNTGRSTGPHLHYEVRINNRAVDPMKIALPQSSSLTRAEKQKFLADIQAYRREMLASLKPQNKQKADS